MSLPLARLQPAPGASDERLRQVPLEVSNPSSVIFDVTEEVPLFVVFETTTTVPPPL